MTTETLVLAFDIERSGGTSEHDTLAIGASVVDSELRELDHLFLPAYFPGETRFESRCYREFWSKNLDILAQLQYKGPKSREEREAEMIIEFMQFRNKWEQHCEQHGKKLELVTDNNVYDGGFINLLIYKHLPSQLPIPYSTTGKYSPFFETHSQQRGLLLALDPNFKSDWGLSARLEQLFALPSPSEKHDHLPHHDACTIAFEQQILHGIRAGKYQRRGPLSFVML